MLLLTAFCVLGISAVLPVLAPIVEHVALFSARLSMPEGTVSMLQERYKDIITRSGESSAAQEGNPASESPAAQPDSEQPSWPAVPQQTPPLPGESSSEPSLHRRLPSQPVIPQEFQGRVQEEDLSGHDGSAFVALQKAWLRNYTDFFR
jgi:stage II sporulation protein P